MIVCLDAQSISTKSQPNIFDNHGCKENLEDTKLFFVRNHIVHSKAGTRNFIRVFDCIYQRGGENHRYEIYLFMFIFFWWDIQLWAMLLHLYLVTILHLCVHLMCWNQNLNIKWTLKMQIDLANRWQQKSKVKEAINDTLWSIHIEIDNHPMITEQITAEICFNSNE